MACWRIVSALGAPIVSAACAVQYIGRIFATKMTRFSDLMPLLLKRAELPEGTRLAIYEEIKFEPTVMVELQSPLQTLAAGQLEDGDILCLQQEPSEVSTSQKYPIFPKLFPRTVFSPFDPLRAQLIV